MRPLQRAVDGWAWYTSNVGQLLPHFEDIEPDDEKEPIPAIGGARFYTWDEISCEFLNPLAKEREEEKDLPPLVQIVPEAGIDLPPAPSGQPPKAENRRLYCPSTTISRRSPTVCGRTG